jgi:hypothetical protein
VREQVAAQPEQVHRSEVLTKDTVELRLGHAQVLVAEVGALQHPVGEQGAPHVGGVFAQVLHDRRGPATQLREGDPRVDRAGGFPGDAEAHVRQNVGPQPSELRRAHLDGRFRGVPFSQPHFRARVVHVVDVDRVGGLVALPDLGDHDAPGSLAGRQELAEHTHLVGEHEAFDPRHRHPRQRPVGHGVEPARVRDAAREHGTRARLRPPAREATSPGSAGAREGGADRAGGAWCGQYATSGQGRRQDSPEPAGEPVSVHSHQGLTAWGHGAAEP